MDSSYRLSTRDRCGWLSNVFFRARPTPTRVDLAHNTAIFFVHLAFVHTLLGPLMPCGVANVTKRCHKDFLDDRSE